MKGDEGHRSANPSGPRSIQPKPSPGTPRRILVVEDQPVLRAYVERVLGQAGFITTSAGDGEEALALAEHFKPFDLLLTDLRMPRMTGTELVRQLRPTFPDLKVLYLTAYRDELFEERGTLSETEACLDKPITGPAILEAVLLMFDDHGGPGRPKR